LAAKDAAGPKKGAGRKQFGRPAGSENLHLKTEELLKWLAPLPDPNRPATEGL